MALPSRLAVWTAVVLKKLRRSLGARTFAPRRFPCGAGRWGHSMSHLALDRPERASQK
jgi:hypothetical protein